MCVSLSHTQFKLIQAWVFQIIVLYQVSLFLVSQPVQFWCFTAPTTSSYYFLPVCSHIFSLSIVVKKKGKKSYTHTKEISLIYHQENKHHLTLRIVLLLYRYKCIKSHSHSTSTSAQCANTELNITTWHVRSHTHVVATATTCTDVLQGHNHCFSTDGTH